ncbi:MAG: efflux RND transporter periplasmic adaptor subunit [Burkholderiaceae bacterium]
MRSWMKWGLALLIVALLAAGATRFMAHRRATAAAVAAQQAGSRIEAAMELAQSDLVQVKNRSLAQGLALSGTLKAANAVLIKARIAGELMGLTLREGDFVKAGQVVARIDATDAQARLRQAQQQAASAKAQVDIAQRSYDNNRSLVDQGFISRSSLDTSQANLAAAEANHRAALAAVDMTGKSLEDAVLRSPISGQVAQRLAQSGERMAVDGRVLEIVDLSRLEMEASLSLADSLQVQTGQIATLQVEGASTTLRAKVARINPSVVAGSRSVTAYLAIDPVRGLRQGLFVQGVLHVGATEGPALPLSAVRTDKPQPYVQLVSNNKVVHQPVELLIRGDAEGQRMVGVKGVAENAMVINGSVGSLREGTLVKVTAGTR